MGKGRPPLAYLVALEEGLRNYAQADSTHTMGERSFVSSLTWKLVSIWRKSWAYITVIRHIRGNTSYNKWHHFLWADYTERNALHATFVNRHLRLSNGSDKHFRGELTNPESWSNPPVKKEIKKTVRTKKKVTVKSEKPVRSDLTPMCFDKVTGKLKEFVDLTDV